MATGNRPATGTQSSPGTPERGAGLLPGNRYPATVTGNHPATVTRQLDSTTQQPLPRDRGPGGYPATETPIAAPEWLPGNSILATSHQWLPGNGYEPRNLPGNITPATRPTPSNLPGNSYLATHLATPHVPAMVT